MVVNYKELKYFQKAHEFTCEIYKVVKDFPKDERFALTQQITRACVSIGSNIAEGSNRGEVEFKRYLQIAVGSAKEVEYQLLLAKDLEYLSINTYDRLQSDLDLIIGSIIKYMQTIN